MTLLSGGLEIYLRVGKIHTKELVTLGRGREKLIGEVLQSKIIFGFKREHPPGYGDEGS